MIEVGDIIEFYLFGAKERGIIDTKNQDGTWNIKMGGSTYPNVKTFKTLPKKKSEIPPWYILTN